MGMCVLSNPKKAFKEDWEGRNVGKIAMLLIKKATC